ncbi:MAG: glycosyltransferase family 39 protein [Caldilineaceae bacterium]|nr:glycosyltransferase family 39 protein [Caldilineaceae bacterium]
MRLASHSTATVHQTAAPILKTDLLPKLIGLRVGYRSSVAILLMLGFGLRLVMLDRFRFHQDEALYSYWALHFLHEDPQFLTQWIDKPPLFVWLLGACFKAFGASEASARLLNVGISVLTIPAVAAIARHAWTPGAALIAAAAFTLNPFAISYSPTAFTDPLFVLGGVLSVCAAQRRRPFWAGLFLGGAVMAKQQGVFFSPLTLAFLVAGSLDSKSAIRAILWSCCGLALAVLPVLYWDSLRWAVAPSPWDLGVRNYGALEIVVPALWPARAMRLGELLWYLTASPVVWIAIAVAAAVVVAVVVLRARLPSRIVPQRREIVAVLICGWLAGFLGFHTVTSLPLWDRYLLPVAPFFAVLVGWIGGRILANGTVLLNRVAIGLWIVLLLPSAAQAARGGIPIGGDHGAYDGLREAIVWLDRHSHEGAVLYHQALNWHLRFYLYDSPNDFRVRWFASPVSLADDAAKMGPRPKFVVVPAWLPLRDGYPHLTARGVELTQRHRVEQFTVFEILLDRR